MVLAIIAHTDIDGVGSASLYVYLTGTRDYRVFFTEPFSLHKALDKVLSAYYEKVVILDVGVNPSVYAHILENLSLLKKNDIPVEWYDHHVWQQEWVLDLEKLGVKLHLDTSTCTAGVVAKYLKPVREAVDRHFVRELVDGICAGDLWKFDHWLGPFFIRLVRRRDEDGWRRHVLETLASGKYWVEDFNERVLEHLDKEFEVFSSNIPVFEKRAGDLKVAVAESSERVENSFLAAYLMGRRQADVVVLVSSDGKLSFRSREVDVRKIALKLGGGGHLYASGAKVSVPWWIKVLSRVNKGVLLRYIASLVLSALFE